MNWRGTGRTEFTIREAALHAKNGKYVLLVAATTEHSRDLMVRLEAEEGVDQALRDKVYFGPHANSGQVNVVTIADQEINLSEGVVRGAHPSVILLADHFTLENHLHIVEPWAFGEWNRIMSQTQTRRLYGK